ncbi:MAG: ABC transporter ATP-binding protein [Clostridiales bacterium]|nr:ABC transporter ATP-binding protein [Clostridiales bacterium]
MMNDIIISLQNISAEYDGEKVIENMNLDIRDHEFVTFLGPSGCGKTTTLRIIGGFVEPTEGDVFFEGKKINDVPPYKRNINTVFQRYALFPHLDVYDNIAFGLRLKKTPKEQIKIKVAEMLKLVNLEGYESRNINQLSGGQQQRVAIARALINEPKVLLLDEPLGALDLKLRKEMQLELKRIQQALGITFIYVTHDQEEALTMSDRVLVMRHGKIQQNGSPEDIYNEPINAFVADFIGESNIVGGVMHQDYLVEFAGVKFECDDKGFEPLEAVDVVIRPEDFKMVSVEEGQIVGKVESITFKGVHFEIIMEGHGLKWMIHSTESREIGAMIGLTLDPDDIHVMRKMEESVI